MANVDVKIEDHTDQYKSAMESAIYKALEMVGMECEKYAKGLCPVDTGRLRNSITHAVQSNETAVIVGTNVEYAPYVELKEKHHKNGQAHFLRDSALAYQSKYADIIQKVLKSS